jgi:hypothetical protein
MRTTERNIGNSIKKVNYLTGWYKPRNRNIRAQDGTVLTEEDQIIERWKEYFQSDQQSIAPIAYYENENPDFPD